MNWTENHIAKHNPWLHAGFWASWVIFFTLLQSIGQESSSLFGWFIYYLFTLPVFIIHTYLIAYWLVPEAFLKRRYGWFTAGILLMLIVFSVLELVISNELIFNCVFPLYAADNEYMNPGNVIVSGIGNQYIILVFMSVKVGRIWYRSRITEEEAKQRNQETTIEIYNSQFRPKVMHHLMMLLEFVVKKDSKRSPEIIILISGFLNVFLNENRKEKMHLSEEIRLMEMYLKIFSAALPKSIRTEFSSEGNFSTLPVVHYLFLPVIDYALNCGNWCNSSCNCSVFIKKDNNHLHFNLSFRSEKKIDQQKRNGTEMLKMRFHKYFPDKVIIKEEKGDTFWKLETDVFLQQL